MQRVFAPLKKAASAARRRSSSAPSPHAAALASAAASVLMPGAGAGEWELRRPPASPGAVPARQAFPSLVEAAAGALAPGEAFELELPLAAGLVQRISLPPSAAPDELEDMARIQLEKILPYPAESVGMALQSIERRETEEIIAVEAVHHDRLTALSQALTARGCWPSRVTFHAQAVTAGAPANGPSLFVYLEAGQTVLALCERGHLCFAQSMGANFSPARLAADLPAVLLGAELEGVDVGFVAVRLDSRCAALAPALEEVLGAPVQEFDAGLTATAPDAGDLSPPGWRAERLRAVRAERTRRRLLLGAAIYGAALVLGFLALGVLRWRVNRLDAQLRAIQPDLDFVQGMETRWRSLAPASQPSHFLVEVLRQVKECLPPGDKIQWTSLEMTPTTLTIQGEAPNGAMAADFANKLKAKPGLKMYRFETQALKFLPDNRASFTVKGVNG